MRILLIDNYDSFTWNLWQQVRSLGAACEVFKNDAISVKKIRGMRPDRIIISPGPGSPKDAGISCGVIRSLGSAIPIFGVCLGHQCIGSVFGGEDFVSHAPTVMHGKTSVIIHNSESIFKDIPSPFLAARYHSLIVRDVPEDFQLLAWTKEKSIMAMRHKTFPIVGVQFHPESFLTEHGDILMRNFLFEQW